LTAREGAAHRVHPSQLLSRRWQSLAIAAILLGHVLVAILYSVWVPLGEAPDEVDHYAYVRHLLLERRLPEGPDMTQGKHPPLYYGLAALVGWGIEPGFEFIRSNPDFSLQSPDASPNLLIHTALERYPYQDGPLVMHRARLLSVLLSTVTVWATWRLARLARRDRPDMALGAAGVLAFVPGFVFISGAVNNDNLATALSALALLVSAQLVRHGLTTRRVVVLGVLLGLGLLAKVSTMSVWPAAFVAVTVALPGPFDGSWRRARAPMWRALLRSAARAMLWTCLTFGLALVVAAPWLVRNWILYGDPLGWSMAQATVDLRERALTWGDAIWLLRGWFTTFWGRFGGAVHIRLPAPVYWLLGVLSALSSLGLIVPRRAIARCGRGAVGTVDRADRVILVLMVLTLASSVLFVVFYSTTALGTDQARLLYPALAPVAFLFYVGLSRWVPARCRTSAASGFSVASALLGVTALLLIVCTTYAPPLPVSAQELGSADRRSTVVFDDQLGLVGYSPSDPIAHPGDTLRFTLYWQARRALATDLRSEVWIVAPDRALVTSWKRSPTGGRHSTDRWPVGVTYADEYALELPTWLAPGHYTLWVGVREFPSEDWLLPEESGEPQHRVAEVRVQD